MPQLKKYFLFALLLMFCHNVVWAQIPQDPTKWQIDVSKLKTGIYELTFKVKLEKGFHIWGTQPGGDGSLIPTSIKLENNDAAHASGSIAELGYIHSETMEFMLEPVRYYADSVTFIQKLEGKSGKEVLGEYTYQVCNELMCLPPITKSFSIKLP